MTIAWWCGFAVKYVAGTDVLVRLSIEERKAKMSTQPMTSEKQTFALAVHFRIAGSIPTPALFIGKMVRNQPENWPESQQKSQQILQNSRMFANVS
jgi:hypothetical protein